MGPELFADFFARQGFRVVNTESAYWYEIHPFCWQSIPYHYLVDPSAKEIRRLFRKFSMLVRFFSKNTDHSSPGYIWIYDQPDYDLSRLETKSRNQTRRGLEQNEIRQLDFALLGKAGWQLLQDTAQRQGRNPDFATPQEWSRYCQAAQGIADFEAWGALRQAGLASFLVAAKVDNYYYILQQASETASLKYYPNNALIYTVVNSKLTDSSINIIAYGLDSVEQTLSGLKKFKEGMGFHLRLLNQRIIINPLFRWVKNRKSISAMSWLLKIYPQSNYLRKAQGVLKKMVPEGDF